MQSILHTLCNINIRLNLSRTVQNRGPRMVFIPEYFGVLWSSLAASPTHLLQLSVKEQRSQPADHIQKLAMRDRDCSQIQKQTRKVWTRFLLPFISLQTEYARMVSYLSPQCLRQPMLLRCSSLCAQHLRNNGWRFHHCH